MRRVALVCLATALVAGCGDEKKPADPVPAFPDQQKAPATPGGKKQPTPGLSRLPAGPGDAPC